MYRKKKNGMASFWFCLFLGGFLLGVILMNVCCEIFLTEEGIFAASDINRLKYLEIESKNFFVYVMKKRVRNAVIPVLLSTTMLGSIAVYGCLVWQGMAMGMMITAAVIRFGIKGLLLILAGVFPHQFLLFPAMIMMLVWCYDNCGNRAVYRPGIQKHYMKQTVSLLWICFMLLIGCILESYVNPMLVSDILKIF